MSVTEGTTASWQNTTGSSVVVRITAMGGSGGSLLGVGGGAGATQSADFVVQNNQYLYAMAATAGTHGLISTGGGGGGASGVINCGNSMTNCAAGEILLIAAGGGGASLTAGLGGIASASTCTGAGAGGAGHNGAGGGGVGGAGGDGLFGAIGGGLVNMTSLSLGGVGAVDLSLVGGAGGNGLGGGGGGGIIGGGGGGGFFGGAAGQGSIITNGSGGTSCSSGTNQSNSSGVSGAGYTAASVNVLCMSLLPVTLTRFDATVLQNSIVQLSWNTASEINNKGFEIERSQDGRDWEKLGFVEGNETTSQSIDYQFMDKNPLTGSNYYRLRQIDMDGKVEYSPVRNVNWGTDTNPLTVYPNPVRAGNIMTVSGYGDQAQTIYLLDQNGKTISKHFNVETDTHEIWLNNDLPKGVYQLVTISAGVKNIKRVIVQ